MNPCLLRLRCWQVGSWMLAPPGKPASKWSYPYTAKQTTEIRLLFQDKMLLQKRNFTTFLHWKIVSTSDNFPCQEMFDIFKNALQQSTDYPYEKKRRKSHFTLLVELHQHFNYRVLVILVGLRIWVFLLEPRTIITRAEDVAGWQQGPPVRREAVLGFLGE